MISTNRLFIRKLTLEDAPFLLKLFNSPSWLTYIGDKNVHTLADAQKIINTQYLLSYKENGFGSYVVELNENQIPIGICGLYKREDLELPDIGFAFLKEYTKRGYGYESSRAVLDFVVRKYAVKTVLGFTLKNNLPSIKLLEKLGLQKSGIYLHGNDKKELLLFST